MPEPARPALDRDRSNDSVPTPPDSLQGQTVGTASARDRSTDPNSTAIDRTALADRLHSAAIHMLRTLRVEDEASGLSPARLSALSVVVFRGPLRLSDLAAQEGVRAPTMSRLARALETKGLIHRKPDPEDGRSTLFEATEAGRQRLGDARSRRLDRLAEGLADLDESSWRHLASAVDVLETKFGRS